MRTLSVYGVESVSDWYKFRGWDATGQKGWVYGDLVHNKRILKDEPFLENRVMVGGYEVVPESVGICTGKTDCHEHLLYEGDICSFVCYGRLIYAKIAYIDILAGFRFVDKDNFCISMDFANGIFHVGNMYENKKFLDR